MICKAACHLCTSAVGSKTWPVYTETELPHYDETSVPAHGSPGATALLVNEAPGRLEAENRIPSIGPQGGNIYRELRAAGIAWATSFQKFSWPTRSRDRYKSPEKKEQAFALRDQFLAVRANYLTCTNAYDRWPRSLPGADDWVDPESSDVLSPENIDRLRRENLQGHQALLVCGEFAWLACIGKPLEKPSSREGTRLSEEELQIAISRLSGTFTHGWYMGHTRRWSLDRVRTSRVLQEIAAVAGW